MRLFRTIKDVCKIAWNKERSPLLQAYRMIAAQHEASSKGVLYGEEERVAKAASRGRITWTACLAATVLFLVLGNLFFGLPFVANAVTLIILILCSVETLKYTFVIWHCRTRGSFRDFLKELPRRPGILWRPGAA